MAGIRISKSAIASLAVFAALAPAQSSHHAKPKSVIAERSANTYAIYSVLLRDDPSPGMAQKQGPVAIAEMTVSINDMNPAISPDTELLPPQNNEKPFEEAVQDFRARRYERLELTRNFHLDSDYTLLNPSEVQSFQRSPTVYPNITFFSEVYFDSKQTAALVYRNIFCGNLCANAQWIYLEKKGKQWIRRSGLNT